MRYLLAALALFFFGCSTKGTFIPKEVKKEKLAAKSKGEQLYDYTKKTLTFRRLDLVYKKPTSIIDDGVWGEYEYYTKDGKKLGKFRLLNKDLAVNADKILILKNKEVIKLPYMVLSATKNKNLLAVVFEDDAMGIYDLNTKKMVFYKKNDPVLSVKYLSSEPVFYGSLVFFPLLDGEVGVYDLKAGKYINSIPVSEGAVNNNIIFLKVVNNQLFMATPSKLVLFNPQFVIDYKADIKHIVSDGKYIYLFLVNGKIIKLDSNLKKIKSADLKFADYFAPAFCKGNIYTVTKNRYFIKITPDLNTTVYEGTKFDTNAPLKIQGCKIYNGSKVFLIE